MIYFIIGLIIGGVGVYFLLPRKSAKPLDETRSKAPSKANEMDLPDYYENKAENLAKLRDYIKKSSDEITNDKVQNLLKVSDATAERYLDEFEKEGLIKQHGQVGKDVYYLKS